MQLPIPDVVMTWQFWAAAVACYIICEAIKRIPYIKGREWIVNIVNLGVGCVLLCLLLGWNWENVIYGVLASAVADIAYQLWSNVINSITGTKPDDNYTKTGGTD